MNKVARAKLARSILKEAGQHNGYKTTCTSAVLEFLGVTRFHYCQTRADIVNILRRHRFGVRSRRTQAGNVTVSGLRKKVEAGKIDARQFIMVFTDGHVLLMARNGIIEVDTDPRTVDRRRVQAVYSVILPSWQ